MCSSARASSARASASSGGDAAGAQRHRDVLARGEHRHQAVDLEHERDLRPRVAGAEPGRLAGVRRGPAGRLEQPARHRQQGRLAGAARPRQGRHPPGLEDEVDVGEQGSVDVVPDAAQRDHRGLSSGFCPPSRLITSRSSPSASMRTRRPAGQSSASSVGEVQQALLAEHGVLGAGPALGADPAVLHRDGAGEGRRDLGLVRHHDEGGVEVGRDPVQEVDDGRAVVVTEGAGRLVGEQQPRAGGDGAREGQALALAAGHGRHRLVALVGQAHALEQLGRLRELVAVLGVRAELGEGEVLPGGGVGQQVAGRALEHGAHQPGPHPGQAALAEPGDLLVAEEDPPGGRPLDAAEQGQQGRLPAAGGAEERHPLARRDAQVEAAQRHHVVPREGAVEVDHALAADLHATLPRRTRCRPGG